MWRSHRGGSDRGRPTPEQIERWRRRTQAPENEIPAGVGFAALLGRTEEAAVGITLVEAFSAGFRLTLAIRIRRPLPKTAHGGLFTLVSAHGGRGGEVAPEDRLLFGVEYANGERASTLEDMRFPGDDPAADDEERLGLFSQGGGGDDLTVDQTYWVNPLPPDGPVTFVLSWPGVGMPESRTEVDGALIRAAAARSVLLWPERPGYEPPPPPPPPRPATGWFSYPD